MGFRFSKHVRIAPGIRLNVSKGGISSSLGGKGLTVNVGPRKTRTTVGLPGTGLSYTFNSAYTRSGRHRSLLTWALLIGLLGMLFYLLR